MTEIAKVQVAQPVIEVVRQPRQLRVVTGGQGVRGPIGTGEIDVDARVDDIAGRAAYDSEAEGFIVLVSNTGDGRAALYVMGSAGAGDWGAPAYVTGAEGPAGDAYESYGVSIYKSDGIGLGGYYAERSANAASTQAKLYAEIIAGEVGSEVDLYVEVAGAPAYGPFTVEQGMPVDLSGLTIAVAEGDTVSFVVTAAIGTVTDIFAKTYGAVS